MGRRKTNPWPETFDTYFGVADEIYESLTKGADQSKPFVDVFTDGLTLADLEPRFVESARAWAQANDMPWPPYLPAAEEWVNTHRLGGV
jgi:hypothetical protein